MENRTSSPAKFASLLLGCALISALFSHADELPSPQEAFTNKTSSGVLNTYKQMSLEELMNQQVTSVSRQPERLANAAAAIQVVTGDDIRRSGASSFPEALRLADNLDIAQRSSASYSISSRGFNASVGNKLLVLFDGRSIYTPLLSGVIWNMQDYLMEDIDRIEVISGPGGTLWGANAVNGVINIMSKDARDTQGTYLEAGGGTWLRDFTGVRYGGMISSNVFFRVYGKYFNRDAEVFADGSDAHDSWDREQGGFRLDADPGAQDHLTLEGDLFGGDTDVVPAGEGTPRATGTASGGDLLGRWTHQFAEDSDMSLQMYYDRKRLGAPFQAAGLTPAGTLFDDLDTYDFDFQDRFPLGGRNRVVWGLEYRRTHDVVHDAPLVAFAPATLDQNLFSGFVQDEVRLHDDVFLTLGTKLEHNDYTGYEVEPSVRLQWNVTEQHMIWAAVSRAVRAPSRYDHDLLEPSPAFGTFLGTNNSDFQSENVIAYELGYRAQVTRAVSGSLSFFYNEYDDLRSLSLTGGAGLPLFFENNLEGHTYGFELTADWQVLDWWRLHAGYDFLQEDIHVKPGQVDVFNALNETADPENQIFVRSSMDLPGGIEFDANFRWIDTIHNNSGGTAGSVPSYPELDLRLGWHATKNVTLSIVGQNLLHDRHPESGFPDSTQEQIVRSIYGEVSVRF